MRVFVTGATGFIGRAVVEELRNFGHDVLGLARTHAAAEQLSRAGATPHAGELTDLNSLKRAARTCDGVIHLAFQHDFSQYERNGEIDRTAVGAFADALAGSNNPLVITSGTTVVSPGRIVTEQDAATRESLSWVRGLSEGVALAAAERGVRSSVVRLPPSVHGPGDGGFVPMLIDIARRTGFAAYVGLGTNRWPAVYRRDAARLYRLAVESASPGSRLHGVAEEGIPTRTIAEAIAQGLGLPARGIAPEEAASHFGWIANFVMADSPTSSTQTREELAWRPEGPGLIKDMHASGYFV